MEINGYKPSLELHNLVKAGFVAQGLSLSAWCKSNDVKLSNIKQCLTGSWDGPKAKELRAKVILDSGLSIQDNN